MAKPENGGEPLFSFAGQMANYIYVCVDSAAAEAVLIDPCWDVASLLKWVREELNVKKITAGALNEDGRERLILRTML